MKRILFLSLFLFAAAVFASGGIAPVYQARWIWFQSPNSLQKYCYYRTYLTVNEPVKRAVFYCYQDDYGELSVNGIQIHSQSFPQKRKPLQARCYDVTKALKSGKNSIAWFLRNDKYSGGLIVKGVIDYESGKRGYFFSNKNWKAASKAADGWKNPDFDDSKWQPAKEFGDANAFPWAESGDIAGIMLTEDEKEMIRKKIEEDSRIAPEIANGPQHKLVVEWKNGVAMFRDKADNSLIPPLLDLHTAVPPYPSKLAMMKKLADCGFRIIGLRIDSKNIDLGNGQYDFSSIDPAAAAILRTVPNALIKFDAFFSFLDSWLERYPDEIIGYATGPADNQITKNWHSLVVGGRGRFPSMASEPFANEIERYVKLLCAHIKKSPWRKRLVLMHVSYGIYSEWHYFGMGGQMPDTGKAMTKVFRNYVKNKYGTLNLLRAAWGDADVTFETVAVPGEKERFGDMLYLRSGVGNSRKVMDYYECHQKVISTLLLRFAAAMKREMPDLLVGAYYGYIFSMSQFPSEGQTMDFERVLASPHIDFLSSPSDYNNPSRQMGGVGMPRVIPATFHRHKKLSITELDLRTYLSMQPLGNDGRNGKEDGEVWKRDLSISQLNGLGVDTFSTNDARYRQSLDDPDILKAMKAAISNWEDIRDNRRPSENRIAVIFNPYEMIWHSYPVPAMQKFNIMLNDSTMHALYRSGYAFDLLSMRDWELSNRKYDCLVFVNAITLTAVQQKLIKERTRQKGMTTIFTYAPGLVTSKGFSKENMFDLTGINLDYSLEKVPMSLTTTDGKSFGNARIKEAPRVFSVDKDVEIMGFYHDKKAAMVRKNFADGSTVFFSGVPINQGWMWAKLFNAANQHCISPDGVAIRYENPFLLIHVRNAGVYQINLPVKAKKVTEVFSKSVIAENVEKVTMHSSGCKTWLLKLDH